MILSAAEALLALATECLLVTLHAAVALLATVALLITLHAGVVLLAAHALHALLLAAEILLPAHAMLTVETTHALLLAAVVLLAAHTLHALLAAEDVDRMIDTNAKGPINTARLLIPYFKNERVAKFPGHISFVSSMAGTNPLLGELTYGASKAAVNLLVGGLGYELYHSKDKLSVSTVLPGPIDTGMQDTAVEQRPLAANKLVNFYFPVRVSPEQVSLRIIENLARAKKGKAHSLVFPSWRESLWFNLGKITPIACQTLLTQAAIKIYGFEKE